MQGAHLCCGWNMSPVLQLGQRGLSLTFRGLICPESYQPASAMQLLCGDHKAPAV